MNGVFRYYECDTMCGRVIPIAANCAAAVLSPNGGKRSGVFIVCPDCQVWLDGITNEPDLVAAVREPLSDMPVRILTCA
jgi:hypothetical protein